MNLNFDNAISTAGAAAVIVTLITVAILFPLLVIWSLNILFSMTIPYTLETWSAVVILQILLHTSIKKVKK